MRLITLITWSLFFMSGCSENDKSEFDAVISEQLSDLYHADPILDFERAIKKNNTKFKGLNAGSLVVPMISKCLIKEFKVDIIHGTSDALENYDHVKLQALARVYAETYNLIMLNYIVENNLSKCENSKEKIYNNL